MSAALSSPLSMEPELSRSNDRNVVCQSVIYFQRAVKSWKFTVPRCDRSNISTRVRLCVTLGALYENWNLKHIDKCIDEIYLLIISLTVSALKGVQVPT